jgi:hypothetical protein
MVRHPVEVRSIAGCDDRDNPGTGKPRAQIVLTGITGTAGLQPRDQDDWRAGREKSTRSARIHRKVSFNAYFDSIGLPRLAESLTA